MPPRVLTTLCLLYPLFSSLLPSSPSYASAHLDPPASCLPAPDQVDTNFINFSIQNKLDIWQSMMDCLYAKCIPYISDCVMAEIEKLGPKFKVALRIAKDSR